jgi:predicted protein tyrosine phosphatase
MEGDKMRAIICGVFMAMVQTIMAATGAEADTNSANFMLPYCKLTAEQASANTVKALLLGQCQGIVETIGQMHQAQLVEGRSLCTDIPDDVTHAQLIQIVLRYGELHPDQTHQPFWLFVMAALRSAWPCKK